MPANPNYHPLWGFSNAEMRLFIQERGEDLAMKLATVFTTINYPRLVEAIHTLQQAPGFNPSLKDITMWRCPELIVLPTTAVNGFLYSGTYGLTRSVTNTIELDVAMDQYMLKLAGQRRGKVRIDLTIEDRMFKYLIWKRLYVLTGLDITTRMVHRFMRAMVVHQITDPAGLTREQMVATVARYRNPLAAIHAIYDKLEAIPV